MENRNICKFPLYNWSNELSVSCFVLETDQKVMQNTIKLSNNRVVLVERGEGEFLINGALYSFDAGALIFAFDGETFALKNGNDVRYLYIDFNGERGRILLQRFGIYPVTRKIEKFNGLIPFCKECLLSSPTENTDIAGESVLLYLFSRLSLNKSKENNILQRIIDFTQSNFNNSELTITTVAKEMGYNAKYLSHFFKAKMKINYSEYLRSIRLKYAISLFENGISSIKNIAFLSGFSDPLYFSNVFKKEIGYSPKKFISNVNR